MRWNVHGLALIALSAAPASGLAQSAAAQASDELDEAARSIDDVDEPFDEARLFLDPSGVEWALDDGVGTDEVPWNDVDPEASYMPLGQVHLGVQLRVAALPGGLSPDGPLLDVSGFVDVRYSRRSAWRFRIGLALSYQAHSEQYLGAGVFVASSPLAARLRIFPIAFDLGRWIGVRMSGDVGMQWTPVIDAAMSTDIFGGATADIVGLLMDGALEVGVTGGFQLTASRRNGRGYSSTTFAADAVAGVTVAYLAP